MAIIFLTSETRKKFASLPNNIFYRELEESAERHMMEVKVYKQKVKHLLYDQENNNAELKADKMVSARYSRAVGI